MTLRSSCLVFALISTLMLFATGAMAVPFTLTLDLAVEDTTLTDPSGHAGPYGYTEGLARIDAFWARNVGTPSGVNSQGHGHFTNIVTQPSALAPFGYVVEYTHAYENDLQGLIITLEHGGTFDLVSLDYDVKYLHRDDEPGLMRLPWSFPTSDPKIVAAPSFDPSLTDFESQWTAFDAISTIHGHHGPGDWHTVDFTGAGLTNLTSVWISQTAGQTALDNIVIDIHAGSLPVPEPSTALLLGLGLVGLTRRRSA